MEHHYKTKKSILRGACLAFFILLFMLIAPMVLFGQTPLTYNSSPSAVILDNTCSGGNGGVQNFAMEVPAEAGTIGAMDEVMINLTHTYTADLEIFVVAPDGTVVELTTDNGGNGDNYTNTHFRTDASTSITAGAAPFTGNFVPEGNLNAMNGKSASGIWYLRICDDAGADIGTLISWSVSFFPPPSNDDPAGAIALTVGESFDENDATGDNTYATASQVADPSIPAPGCAAYNGGDMWYTVTVPQGGRFVIETALITNSNTGLAIYALTDGVWSVIACNDNNGISNASKIYIVGRPAGETLYARVWGNNGLTGTFAIAAWLPPLPANDDPAGAIALAVGASSGSAVVNSNNFWASASDVPNPACGGYDGGDVWYKVMVPASGALNVTSSEPLSVYSGPVDNLVMLNCNSGGGPINVSGRTPGEVLYARVWRFGGGDIEFQIQAFLGNAAEGANCLSAVADLNPFGLATVNPSDLVTVMVQSVAIISVSGNNGVGNGTTDFTVTVSEAVDVSFDWAYSTNDGPAYDNFGYLLNGTYVQLTNDEGVNSQSGTTNVTLIAGDTFGFRSLTTDGCCGAATTTITNFMPGFSGQFALGAWQETNSAGTDATTSIGTGLVAADASLISSITADPIQFTSAGNFAVPVTVTMVGGAVYQCTAQVTVNKAIQTIAFDALPLKTYGDADFELSATGGNSGNAITFSSSNTNVATISGTTVTIVGAGETTITASQAGNENYNAAASVQQTLTVNKADQTITFNPILDRSVTDPNFSPASSSAGLAIAYSSSNESVAVIVDGMIDIVGVGNTTITASQAGNANYNAASSVQQTLTVNTKLSQSITFDALPAKVFGDANFALSATGGNSGNAITYSSSNTNVATISGSTVTIVGAGTTTITANQAGNANYNPAIPVDRVLTVNKANQIINFGALAAKTYGDANFALSATGGASGSAVTFSSSNTSVATVSGNTITIVGAGTTTITASQAGNANYNAAASVEQTLTVNKADQIITFNPILDRSVTDPNFNPAATSSAGLAIAYFSSNESVAVIVDGMIDIVGVGSTTITASQAGNTNYNAASSVQQTLIVNTKQSQSITFNALPAKAFGDANFALSATGGNSGNAITFNSSNTNVATISGSTVTIVGVGTTTITASQAGNADYNPAIPVDRTLTVNKADQLINFGALATKTFGDAAFTVSATGGASGNEVTFGSSNTSVATVAGNTVTIVGAGTTSITANQAGNTNYNAASVEQTLTVNKADQLINFGALAAKTFGDAAFTVSATGGASGNEVTFGSSNTSVATISGNTVTIVGGGTTTITANQAGNANYNAATVEQTLTVNKAAQAINFSALAAKTFGDAAFTVSATGGASGNAVTFSSSNTAVATVSGSTVTIVGAGTTTITANQAGNASYNAATAVEQALTVNKANQTITFGALAAKTFGDAAFTVSAIGGASGNTVTYNSSNTSVATVSGSTVTIVGGGTTTITANQAGNTNYNAASVEQTLTVNKADQTITFGTIATKTLGDAAFNLGATTTATGLAITYTATPAGRVTIANGQATLTGAGRVTITATQAGNANYNAATEQTQTFCINPATPVVTASFTNPEAPVLTSSAANGNQWYQGADAIAGATNPTYTVSGTGGAGSYKVQSTVDDCVSQFSNTVSVVITGDLSSPTEITAWPNPVSDYLTIEGVSDAATAKMMSTEGREVSVPTQHSGSKLIIDMRSAAQGVYYVQVKDHSTVKRIRVIRN